MDGRWVVGGGCRWSGIHRTLRWRKHEDPGVRGDMGPRTEKTVLVTVRVVHGSTEVGHSPGGRRCNVGLTNKNKNFYLDQFDKDKF